MSDQRRLRAVGAQDAPTSGTAASELASARRSGPDLADVMARVARGSVPAFEQLYDALAGSVYGVALRIVRDPHLAEDVAQEVLAHVWVQACRYRPELGSVRAWVLTMAQRRAVDRVRTEQAHTARLRTHGPAQVSLDNDDEAIDDVVDTMVAQWEATRVAAGMRRLSAVQREALELTYFRGYTHREVAQSLGIPLGTAKARVRDGLIKLGSALGGTR